ncbi:MAG: hypothetical protein HY553_16980 [Elusimicrobia bacterium]|nr:hypothetical protein [Elusimicrobiota bacterium]
MIRSARIYPGRAIALWLSLGLIVGFFIGYVAGAVRTRAAIEQIAR